MYDPLRCPLFLIEERPLKSNWMILKLTSLRTYGTIEVRHANVSKMRTCIQTSFRQQPVAGSVLDQSAFSEDQKEKVLDNFKLLDQSKSGKELKEFQFHIQSMCKFLVRRSLEPTAGADGMLRFFGAVTETSLVSRFRYDHCKVGILFRAFGQNPTDEEPVATVLTVLVSHNVHMF